MQDLVIVRDQLCRREPNTRSADLKPPDVALAVKVTNRRLNMLA